MILNSFFFHILAQNALVTVLIDKELKYFEINEGHEKILVAT